MKNSANKILRKVLSIIICLALVMNYVLMVNLTAFAAGAEAVTATIDNNVYVGEATASVTFNITKPDGTGEFEGEWVVIPTI